jgi:hypothetical protein
MILCALFPHVDWRLVFTDTGAEEVETLEMLDQIEAITGRRIERLMDKGLFDLIKDYGGFLPSPTDRYCTRQLKLVPFRRWLEQFKGKQIWLFVGIRYDENTRIAFTLPDAETVMPFIDMKFSRAMVYDLMSKTLGIPRSYQTRTRSGCFTCPYQTTREIVGLLQRSPEAFDQGAQFEKLLLADLHRHEEALPLWHDSGIALNWQSFPLPRNGEDIQGRIAVARQPDLFGVRLFAAVEFFMDGLCRPDEFIWAQRLVCYSTTLAGLKKQVDGRFQHLLSVAEVYGMTPEEVRLKVKFAVYYVELPSDVFDPAGVGEGSYTWQQGISYRQIRHIVTWTTRVLHGEFMRREAQSKPHLLSVQHEWKESSIEGLNSLRKPIGAVLLEQWYEPSEKIVDPENEDEALKTIPCPMCHL